MAKKKPEFEQEEKWEKEDQELELAADAEWTKRIVLDIPIWALKALDKEAHRRGIARQALIKGWLVDRLDGISGKKAG